MTLFSYIITLKDAKSKKLQKLLKRLEKTGNVRGHGVGHGGKNYGIWAVKDLSQLLKKMDIKFSIFKKLI